jgi:hypothetical protein
LGSVGTREIIENQRDWLENWIHVCMEIVNLFIEPLQRLLNLGRKGTNAEARTMPFCCGGKVGG